MAFPGVALVTGAGSGIGRAIAIQFTREGVRKIAICDRDFDALLKTNAMIHEAGYDIMTLPIEVDVMNEDEIKAFMGRVGKELGGIQYAVNVAGIASNGQPSTETVSEVFDRIHSVNCRGVWLSSKYELQQMLKQDVTPSPEGRSGERGSIVNIGSQLALGGSPGSTAYVSAKAAVIAITKCDAIDYAPKGIRINCVCPGCIETPMTTEDMTPEKEGWLKAIVEKTPMKRMGTVQEIADAVMFLSSSKASFMQGSVMLVDGGYVIN
ncbi:MAG: hypothetical protein M1827_001740 [Pycnora praestabilis]|nr:MAG: hypothetical protein M1827_001740 [Pycnora praestabilis]